MEGVDEFVGTQNNRLAVRNVRPHPAIQ